MQFQLQITLSAANAQAERVTLNRSAFEELRIGLHISLMTTPGRAWLPSTVIRTMAGLSPLLFFTVASPPFLAVIDGRPIVGRPLRRIIVSTG
jgi:hypothetical protein